MIPDFLLYALLAGALVAIAAAPIGSLVVWQRLAYFGDTLAHGALLGCALGVLLAVDIALAVLLFSALLALLLVWLRHHSQLANDTLLGILSHGSLALGLVVISAVPALNLDLSALLFGDVLAVGADDLLVIAGVCALVLALVWWQWTGLIAVTVDAELAQVDGLPVGRLQMLQMLLIALLVAAAMKVVGALLITALLIIPPATARAFARSPEQMVWCAAGVGIVSVALGLAMSVAWDYPAGPAMVLAATLLFLGSNGVRGWVVGRTSDA